MSQPATGALAVRVNPDSLRKIDVRSSRYSSQFGKGSGGLVDLQVQDGDNQFRINATDFVPTLQNVKGLQINNWTPRGYFSGPLVRDKIWFDFRTKARLITTLSKSCRTAQIRTVCGEPPTWPACA